MKKIFVLASLIVVVAMLLVSVTVSVSAIGNCFSYGESSEGAGPCLENRWGKTAGVGYSYGESSEGAGPCLENRWGQTSN